MQVLCFSATHNRGSVRREVAASRGTKLQKLAGTLASFSAFTPELPSTASERPTNAERL